MSQLATRTGNISLPLNSLHLNAAGFYSPAAFDPCLRVSRDAIGKLDGPRARDKKGNCKYEIELPEPWRIMPGMADVGQPARIWHVRAYCLGS
jgi:hypothetical protein